MELFTVFLGVVAMGTVITAVAAVIFGNIHL